VVGISIAVSFICVRCGFAQSDLQFLLDSEFMGRGLIWPKYLGKVFAGLWPGTQGSHVLSFAYDLVATLREFRNRLFHHEPAWKRFGVLTEADAIRERFIISPH
jgi:hypothetical protein